MERKIKGAFYAVLICCFCFIGFPAAASDTASDSATTEVTADDDTADDVALDADERPSEIRLNADGKVEYDQDSGVATAEGNVRLTRDDLRLHAPFMEYDVDGGRVQASGNPDGVVTVYMDGRKLTGEKLTYDLNTKRGVMTHASGRMEGLYLNGNDIEVAPLKVAREEGWAPGKGESEEDVVARWMGVRVSTCSYENSHYRLQSKEVVVIPGRRVIVKNPRVYIGETMLFSYPFDYVMETKKSNRSRSSLLPIIGYESSKGGGLGLSGPIVWGTGALELGAIGWTGGEWEGWAHLYQNIGDNVRFFALADRLYDKDSQITEWRPQWGIEGTFGDVTTTLRWSQRELFRKEIRAGVTRRYSVWRDPEFLVATRWFEDPASGFFAKLSASYGKYSDNYETDKRARYGAKVELYREVQWGDVQPFLHGAYTYYKYPDDSESQHVTYVESGFRWNISGVSLKTSYIRRWVSGYSPMEWDSELPRNDVYQEIKVPISRNALGDQIWYFTVRGGYDIQYSRLGEMVYKLAYDHHCIVWEVVYRDDRVGSDNWVGLNFVIKQYPEQTAMTTNELFEPGKRPDDLPEKKNVFDHTDAVAVPQPGESGFIN